MIATHIYKEVPVRIITLKFVVSALHIETAAVALLTRGDKPTKKLINSELENMLRSGGSDGATDWVDENDIEMHIKEARNITRKLYPTFYK